MRSNKARQEYYRSLADRYAKALGVTEYELDAVIQWADEKGLLDLRPEEVQEVHRTILQDALRSDYGRDAQGRRVRQRYCVESKLNGTGRNYKLRSVWAKLSDARAEFIRKSLFQRRRMIYRDCKQLRIDVEYANTILARKGANLIHIDFDFTAELEADDNNETNTNTA